MHRIVDRITLSVLERMSQGNDLFFNAKEAGFCRKFAPLRYSGRGYEDIHVSDLNDDHKYYEVLINAFGIVVRLDHPVREGANLEALAQEKAKELNPMLRLLGIQAVDGGEPLEMIVQLKEKGLEALRVLTTDVRQIPYETVERKPAEAGRFSELQQEVQRVFSEFADDFSVRVYGSSLKGNSHNDWDVIVNLPEISHRLYSRLRGRHIFVQNRPVEYAIVPVAYQTTFDLSDRYQACRSANSVLLNQPLLCPLTSREHVVQLKLHDVAHNILVLREAMARDGYDSCRGVLRRFNSRIKRPKFVASYLNYVLGQEAIPEPEPRMWAFFPKREYFYKAMAVSNMQMNRCMEQFFTTLINP